MDDGFPHSGIFGSQLACQLPEAYRRLLRPSSPPDAKASTMRPFLLIHQERSVNETPKCLFTTSTITLCAKSKISEARRSCVMQEVPGLSKTGSSLLVPIPGCMSVLRKGRNLLLKEVIQPQVPLRLPCYDFTPIANQTVGASLPCGLGQRLQVQPTLVV